MLFACSRSDSSDYNAINTESSSSASNQSTMLEETEADITQDPARPVISDMSRQIVKTANVVLEVKQNETYTGFLKSTLQQVGAFVSKEDNSFENDRRIFRLDIKVPVQQFDKLLESLVGNEAKLLERNIETKDVTGSVIDTKARLEARKRARDKYLEFLQKATQIEDVLKVQQRIDDIQEEIESAEAQLMQLAKDADYSTIRLIYFEEGSGGSYYQNKSGFFSRILSAFVSGGKMFFDLLVGVVAIWPVWLVVILLVFIYRKWKVLKRMRTGKNV